MKIEHFQGGPSWCFRFMKRCRFSIRTGTTAARRRPADYDEKLSIIRSYCSKHIADINTSSPDTSLTWTRCCSLSTSRQEESPSKRRTEDWNDENETNMEIAMFAPLESDLDESANSVPEDQLVRTDTEGATVSNSGNQQEEESRGESKDDDETIIHSDAESESLLLPVQICFESSSLSGASYPSVSPAQPKDMLADIDEVKTVDAKCSSVQSPDPDPVQHTSGPFLPQQSSLPSPPSPWPSPGSPPPTSSSVTPAPPETTSVSSHSPTSRPSNPESSIDATNFWKSCNAAGCTQAIFTDFINGMNEISNRILSDKASREDYDLALSVMTVSGKLAELVAKQEEELQRKQIELQKAAAAMKDVVSALRK